MTEKPRFLIVDDLVESRDLLVRIVRYEFPGCEILQAPDGDTAIAIVRGKMPDLVMLDAHMPGMSGFEVCRQLKNDPVTSSILVMMISAMMTETVDRISGLDSGADSYICKPFESDELLAQVRALLRIRAYEKDLEVARRVAEEAARVKSQFLAAMSHEIRTPMNAVIGMTSLLANTRLDDQQREFVNTIRSSGESLLTVINDILDFSKIESGRLSLEQQVFNLNACVEDVVSLLAVKAHEKGLELAFWIESDVPESIYGDFDRLRQILLNLIGNAIKFTANGEVFIEVKACPVPREASSVDHPGDVEISFHIHDTGIGIEEDQLPRLFEAFSQVDASNTRRFMGTGLGLAICKRLVDMMGGSMAVTSRPGEGSTFSFALPAQTAPGFRPIKTGKAREQLKGLRALVVDDVAINRKIVRMTLDLWGMETVEADSGRSALALLEREGPFNLAILDMQMPEMDGVMLAREIRGRSRQPDLPIIILTSLGVSETRDDAGDVAVEAFLQKPVKPQRLQATLQQVLSGGEVPRLVVPEENEYENRLADQIPMSILLAEDNMVNQRVASLMLGKLGYQVDCVANGQEAVKALQQRTYDVVLMDGQMPELDGYEATRRIRASLPVDQQPYIIALTAGVLKGEREKCFEAGMNDFVAKPVRVDALTQALQKAADTLGRRVTLEKS